MEGTTRIIEYNSWPYRGHLIILPFSPKLQDFHFFSPFSPPFLLEIHPGVVVIGFFIYSVFANFNFLMLFFSLSQLSCRTDTSIGDSDLHPLGFAGLWGFLCLGGGTAVLSPLAVTLHSGETWFKPNCDRPSLHTHGRIKNKGGCNDVWGEDLLPTL